MKSICINYITHPGKAEENIQLITEVFKQLLLFNVSGIKYTAFKMGENVFVHLAQFESEEAVEAFHRLPACQAFQKDIADRLISEPILVPIIEIGSISTLGNLSKNGEM